MNFTNAVAAFRFFNSFHKRVWEVAKNKKTCEVTVADIQVYFPCSFSNIIPNFFMWWVVFVGSYLSCMFGFFEFSIPTVIHTSSFSLCRGKRL